MGNVTFTGRNRGLVGILKRRKVDICCFQDTKWEGEKANEIEESYKITGYM